MEPQGRTSRWGIALAILVIAAGIAGFFVWESAGRPGLSTGEVALSDEAAAKMTVYHRLCEGKALAGEGKHADALAIFDDIVRTETGSAYAWDADIQAAHSMAYLGQHEEALARLDRTIADCPLPEEIPKARLTEADVYSLAGQNDRAAKLFEKLIMEYTDAWPWICEEALVGMTTVYSRTGQFGLVRAAMARLIPTIAGRRIPGASGPSGEPAS